MNEPMKPDTTIKGPRLEPGKATPQITATINPPVIVFDPWPKNGVLIHMQTD
jgi:hypothetical protein